MENLNEALIRLYAIVEQTEATTAQDFKRTLLSGLMREIDKTGELAHPKMPTYRAYP